ncbi:MAG TPA: DUF4337 family protein [Candidatus Acidoferrales bacterium]|nr:DUF4337 family protein [Candidatus Acidoferrales bacterium]
MSAHAAAPSSDRLVPFFTAIVAVLAALGTLFATHRSIQGLAVRNDAVILTAKASDQYQYFQAKELKATLYSALSQKGKVSEEQRTSLAVFAEAKRLDAEADKEQERADALMRSFEILEIATTLFEIAIAFASIAALTGARFALWPAVALSAVGIVVGIAGYFQAH